LVDFDVVDASNLQLPHSEATGGRQSLRNLR
jgi:hypothetical protein